MSHYRFGYFSFYRILLSAISYPNTRVGFYVGNFSPLLLCVTNELNLSLSFIQSSRNIKHAILSFCKLLFLTSRERILFSLLADGHASLFSRIFNWTISLTKQTYRAETWNEFSILICILELHSGRWSLWALARLQEKLFFFSIMKTFNFNSICYSSIVCLLFLFSFPFQLRFSNSNIY